MIQYRIYYTHPHRHFISFEARFPCNGKSEMSLQLAAWRPGRYELGNFAKNIRGFMSMDPSGNAIEFRKVTKDNWIINSVGCNEIVVRYQYYGAELNAGSSYLDEEQLYLNPVNCFFYDVNDITQSYKLKFELPKRYVIACGLDKISGHVLSAKNFDELADCPLIASDTIVHRQYQVDGVLYHIHIRGDVKLDEERLLSEFQAFTIEHLKIFGSIPADEYHFLFHFLPHFVRHGVEHRNSTVITMGPAADFQNDSQFSDLLGISCHELFHTWNIKCIRPADMMPYDFTRENYTRLGYVAEGVTTYYGDYLLWRSGAFPDEEWFDVIREDIQTHLDNNGRFNHSVADSSFDTWLDGYGQGIPWRKVSIYNEGFLISLICDIEIRKRTSNRRSLDDVMRILYNDFGKKSIGYTDEDYQRIVSDTAGTDMSFIFDSIVYDHQDYTPFLKDALEYVGLEITSAPSPKWSEANLGLFLDEGPGKITVQSVIESSPADSGGLWNGDEIIAVNGAAPYKNCQHMLRMNEGEIEITFLRKGALRFTAMKPDGIVWAKRYSVVKSDSLSASVEANLQSWKSS